MQAFYCVTFKKIKGWLCRHSPASVPPVDAKAKKNKELVHFRFDADLNELLEAASAYLGTTKTELVENCIRLNLDEVISSEEGRKAAAAKLFKKVRRKTEL